MPVAVANVEETTTFDLKSLEGGQVTLRRMTYGQVVQRRTLAKMTVATKGGSRRDAVGEMAMASKEITLFEFSHCIASHNLEDVDGRPLVLSGPDFDKLNPKVGQEIEDLISKMNNFEDEEEKQGE